MNKQFKQQIEIMKKKQYIAPRIDVSDVVLQGLIAASTSSDSVFFNNREIDEDEVAIDDGGGISGELL